MKIPCICIDAKNKPSEIPGSKWVVEKKEYHVTHVYKQLQQNGIKGVELAEHDISECVPFNCYRLDRFAFTQLNLIKLVALMNQCTELDKIDIQKLVEKLTTIETVEN